jgi:hypothetical protein
MANWSNPTLTSTYTNFVTEVKDRDVEAAVWFEGMSPTNLPTNAKRLNTTTGRFEKWNGTAWVDAVATFTFPALSVAGAATFNGNVTLGDAAADTVTVTGTATFSAPATFSNATSPIISAKIGPVAGQQHTLPAVASDTLALLAATQTLTNKTLTAPKFATGGFIADANGSELLIFTTTASAVNEFTFANAATGGTPTLSATGGDTNISLNLVAKGTGTVNAGGVPVVTTTGTQTLTNKTLTSPTINTATFAGGTVNNASIGATTPNTGAFTTLSASGQVSFTGTGAATMNAGTTAQRPTGVTGMFRFNSTLGKFEGYNGTAWGAVGGGATGGGSDDIFVENGQTVTTNYTITTGKNAMSAGPVTISSGITVTVPSGSTWVVV